MSDAEKYVQLVPLPVPMYAVYSNYTGDGQEGRERCLFAALTSDGDINILDFDPHGCYETPEISSNFVRYETEDEVLAKYNKLLTAARIMHFDLIKKGEIPLQEMVDMFGNKV